MLSSLPSAPRVAHRGAVDVALVAVALAWGSSYLATKEVVEPDGVFAFLVIRFGVATAALAILTAPALRGITGVELRCGALFGLILSVVLTLETYGVTLTSASNAGLIISLTIVMTPLLERWVRGTRVPRAFHGATVVTVVGIACLTQTGGWAAPSPGDLLILFAAVARAVHVTVIARVSEHRALDSARMTLVQLCTALAVFAVVAPMTGRPVTEVAGHMSGQAWALTGYLALVCTVFAFLVQIRAVRCTSPARVSLLLGTEPLWAAVVGVLLAGDPVTALGVLGAVLVLAGINWGRTVDRRGQRRPVPLIAAGRRPNPRRA